MPDEFTASEIGKKVAELRERSAELFAEHLRLHDELVQLFKRIEQIHNQPPVLTDRPPPDPPPPPPAQ